MQVHITARHLKLTSAIADYVQKKVDKANRFLDHIISSSVILDVSKNSHICEIVIHASGKTFTAKEDGSDLYAAIDLASDKIDEQLRRFKERRGGHRGAAATRRTASASWPSMPEDPAPASDHRISSMRVLQLIPLTLPEAVSAMEQSDSAHWIFLNRDNQRVTVIYRKPDKSYGVVESVS